MVFYCNSKNKEKINNHNVRDKNRNPKHGYSKFSNATLQGSFFNFRPLNFFLFLIIMVSIIWASKNLFSLYIGTVVISTVIETFYTLTHHSWKPTFAIKMVSINGNGFPFNGYGFPLHGKGFSL